MSKLSSWLRSNACASFWTAPEVGWAILVRFEREQVTEKAREGADGAVRAPERQESRLDGRGKARYARCMHYRPRQQDDVLKSSRRTASRRRENFTRLMRTQGSSFGWQFSLSDLLYGSSRRMKAVRKCPSDGSSRDMG